MYLKTSLLVAAVSGKMTRTTTTCIQSFSFSWMFQSAQPLAPKTGRYALLGRFKCVVTVSLLAIATASLLMAEVPKQARAAIDRAIGSPGTYYPEEGVYRIVLPQTEATVVLDYQTLSPNFGLNSWVSFTSAVHHEALPSGQLLLLEDEVNPVMTAVLNAGLEINGLADSSTFDGPRLKTLDVTGIGTYQSLASAFRNALDEIRRTRVDAIERGSKVGPPILSLDSSINPHPLDDVLSMRGSVSAGVYRAAIGRRALSHGETIGREMGVTSWISLSGTDDRAFAQGEFVATSDELQNLLRALRSKNIKIVSIRNHMVGEHPQLLYVRFWDQGRTIDIVTALRYALNVQVGITAAPPLVREF
jgi:hypothetical protein